VLRLTDARTEALEVITPATPRRLRVFVCGPGLDHDADVADLRPFVVADLIRRTADVVHDWQVVLAASLHDVGPPQRTTGSLQADLAAMNVYPADPYARTGEHIALAVDLVSRLIERGHAYAKGDGGAYFRAGAHPPADWALWTAESGDVGFAAPWGRGLPSRAVASSAVKLHFLGDRIDVQVTDADPQSPDQQQDRAQSDAAVGRQAVGCEVWTARVAFEASPSASGVPRLSDVVERGPDPLAVRLAMLLAHYRDPLELSWDTIAHADQTLARWRSKVAEWATSTSKPMSAPDVERVHAALDDDLDTVAALAAIRRLEDADVATGSKFETFAYLDRLLGLDLARDVGRAPAALHPPDIASTAFRRTS
jgi:cysteinyl-tRNA synthetase